MRLFMGLSVLSPEVKIHQASGENRHNVYVHPYPSVKHLQEQER